MLLKRVRGDQQRPHEHRARRAHGFDAHRRARRRDRTPLDQESGCSDRGWRPDRQSVKRSPARALDAGAEAVFGPQHDRDEAHQRLLDFKAARPRLRWRGVRLGHVLMLRRPFLMLVEGIGQVARGMVWIGAPEAAPTILMGMRLGMGLGIDDVRRQKRSCGPLEKDRKDCEHDDDGTKHWAESRPPHWAPSLGPVVGPRRWAPVVGPRSLGPVCESRVGPGAALRFGGEEVEAGGVQLGDADGRRPGRSAARRPGGVRTGPTRDNARSRRRAVRTTRLRTRCSDGAVRRATAPARGRGRRRGSSRRGDAAGRAGRRRRAGSAGW